VESESEEVEMKEVNDPVSRPSPSSQVSGRNITDPASKEEKRESENVAKFLKTMTKIDLEEFL